jgi:hypothetical protein
MKYTVFATLFATASAFSINQADLSKVCRASFVLNRPQFVGFTFMRKDALPNIIVDTLRRVFLSSTDLESRPKRCNLSHARHLLFIRLSKELPLLALLPSLPPLRRLLPMSGTAKLSSMPTAPLATLEDRT